MTFEGRDCFKTKLRYIALSPFKFFSDNCKFEYNLSGEEINFFKALRKNRNVIIQKVDKSNTIVITDKEKYVKRAI